MYEIDDIGGHNPMTNMFGAGITEDPSEMGYGLTMQAEQVAGS